MKHSVFLLFAILSIHILAGLSLAKQKNVDIAQKVNHAITGTVKNEQADVNLELLLKRVEELEKKVQKLENGRQFRVMPLGN